MTEKRSRPMIGKLSELLVSGGKRAGVSDLATSPRSPLELKLQSPRGLKNYDVGGVGLGIVAALERSGDGRGPEVLAKYAVCGCNRNRSNPIPVNSGKMCERLRGGFEEFEGGSSEDYTYVTCHGPSKSFTRVYYDGGHEYGASGHERNAPARCSKLEAPKDTRPRYEETFPASPTADFLSACHLCRRKLHGKDIYMYRGEKAFCSTECRSRQIMIDERKEQCRSEAPRSADVSSSPYTRGQIFSTGILAI